MDTQALTLVQNVQQGGSSDNSEKRVDVVKLKPGRPITGICYGPFRKNQDPDQGVYPEEAEMRQDIKMISKYASCLRSYGATDTLGLIPKICEENNMDCIPGAWIGKYAIENNQEVEALMAMARSHLKNIKGLIVGNETLFREDTTEENLESLIKRVKDSTDIPVGTAELWKILLQKRKLADSVDFIVVHIHPYWDGVPASDAGKYVADKYDEIKKAFPGKQVMIGETGWPTQGSSVESAVPSQVNQAVFSKVFIPLAKDKDIPYFIFEAFDEPWKEKFEGNRGAYWGLWDEKGAPKQFASTYLGAVKEYDRKEGQEKQSLLKAPVCIYSDGGSPENKFQPTGLMGDIKYIKVERKSNDNPHSGDSCLQIEYKSGGYQRWGGVYFQHPINNWGDHQGYKITGAKTLTFWARGEKGGEGSEFKFGGIIQKQYKDSVLYPLTTGEVSLKKDWQKYSIDLSKADLSNVIGGFCWVTVPYSPSVTVYLDDIKIE